jgi:hypothetical protein
MPRPLFNVPLIAIAALACGAAPVSAATTVHCGEEISHNTRVSNDLLNCPGTALTVTADDVTVDLGGHLTAVCTADPDTFFSQPARVTVDGKTVSGFLSTGRICTRCLRSDTDHDCRQPDGSLDFFCPRCPNGDAAQVQDEVWVFTSYRYAKNARLIVGKLEQEQAD